MKKVLIVDEDLESLKDLKKMFEKENYECLIYDNPKKALSIIKEKENDLNGIITELIFDEMLEGIDFIKEIRSINKEIPILVVSSEKKVKIKVSALTAGADDYIEKPFSEEEILARLKAHIRKINTIKGNLGLATIVHPDESESIGVIGNAKIYFDKMMIKRGNKEIFLTTKENSILQLLYKNRGKVVSREKMMKEIWSEDSFVTERVIDTNVVSIRKKIGDTGRKSKYIKTVFGIGYKLVEEE
jgi:two-component system response regulator VicR